MSASVCLIRKESVLILFGWSHFPLLFVAGLDESGQIIKWKDGSSAPTSGAAASTSGDDMLSRMRDRNFRDLIYLINKPPRWNEQVGAYVLNFNGRVTMASVKNFQLVDPEEQNAVVLQVRQRLHHGLTPTLALLFLMCCSSCWLVWSRGQGRVHDGSAVACQPVPGLRSHAKLFRFQDRLRLVLALLP